MIIYKATNIINGKVYIGKTEVGFQKRISNHKYNSKKLKNYFYNAIRKYGWENFKWEVICTTDSKDKLNLIEKFYIAAYRKITDVYNSTDGGEGTSGIIMSIESRKKMSIAKSGKSPWNKGKKYNEKTRKKISEVQKGRIPWNKGKSGIYSEEVRKKMSDSHKGKAALNKRPVLNLDTSMIFDSILEAAKYYNTRSGNIVSVCKGDRLRCCGYRWEYVSGP